MRELPRTRQILLCVTVIAQAVTVLITWQLWQVREEVPNLYLIEVPQLPFGILMLLSLLPVFLNPRKGVWIHLALLLVACVFDQFRLQPQFFTIWALMLAAADERATPVVRWYLVALWLWTGAHKLLSPDWFAHCSYHIGRSLGLEEKQVQEQLILAFVIGASEVGLGVLAWAKPKWGTFLCVALHLGIAAFLSPIAYDWNYSVIPWNICMAVIGGWMLWISTERMPASKLGFRAFIAFMVIPAGFYTGLVDRSMAHVLYSENYPSAVITRMDGSAERIEGWGELAVPIPPERRLFRQYFELVAKPGEKLHISDPRWFLEDEYLVKRGVGSSRRITRKSFHEASSNVTAGYEADSHRNILALSRADVSMKQRTKKSMIFAVSFSEQTPIEVLPLLAGLPNIEQLKMNDTSVGDADLEQLPEFPRLTAIGLNNTAVTESGLARLAAYPKLNYLEFGGRSYSGEELRELIKNAQ